MAFIFKEKASYLYDFCMFPKLLYVVPEEIYKLNDVLEDEEMSSFIDHKAHMKFIELAQQDLEPYKDPLLGFYADEAISNYDFPALLFKSYSFLKSTDYKDYLQTIMQEDELTIKKNLIHALLTIESDEDETDDAKSKVEAERLLNNRDDLVALIRKTPTTENHRWILMLLIENPKDYLEVYLELLKNIEPVFTRYLDQHKAKIQQFKDEIMTPLEKDGEAAFETLTQGIVPNDVLDKDNLVITSFVSPYRFSFLNFGGDRVMLFGLEMKMGFKKIAEFEQDSRKNRAKVFKTLSDETRYEVLKHLANGTTSTKAIANAIGVSSATVTYHINAFLTAKVIKVVKSKKAKYSVDFERLETFWQDFMNDLKEH